jgi:hypothetical protein
MVLGCKRRHRSDKGRMWAELGLAFGWTGGKKIHVGLLCFLQKSMPFTEAENMRTEIIFGWSPGEACTFPFIVVMGGRTLWPLRRILQCIKYIMHEPPSQPFFFIPSPLIPGVVSLRIIVVFTYKCTHFIAFWIFFSRSMVSKVECIIRRSNLLLFIYRVTLQIVCHSIFFNYCFYIYLHVYTLFGPPPPHHTTPPGRTCSALLFSDFV